MRSTFALVVITVASGCNPGVIVLDTGNDGGGAAETSTAGGDGPSASGTPLPDDTTTTGADDGSTFGADSSEAGMGFISELDIPPMCAPIPGGATFAFCSCDTWAQDCPLGEKCVPYSADGRSDWSAGRCTTVAEDPAPIGEPCTMFGSPYSGLDDCDIGAMCWGVDPETLEGTCVPLCGDSAEEPCTDDRVCSIASGGAIAVCLPPCDPLPAGGCPLGESCIHYGDEFVCSVPFPDAASFGKACEQYGCGAGLVCDSSEPLACDGPGCCAAICDLADPDPDAQCPDEGLTCVPFHDRDRAPEGLEDVGICSADA